MSFAHTVVQHFAQDDPELYSGQVQHLLRHGTDLLPEPMQFTDTLVTHGGAIKVRSALPISSSLQ